VQFADTVGQTCGAQRKHCHAELRPPCIIVPAQVQETLAIQAHPAPVLAEVTIHEVETKRVIARRHRGVRGKQCIGARGPQGCLKGQVILLHQLANALKLEESGMPLVHMPNRRLQTQRAKCTDAPDAQHDLLRDTNLHIAPVQACRELTIAGGILLHIGVHEIDRHAAHLDAPYFRVHRAAGQIHMDENLLPVTLDGRLRRHLCKIELLVDCFLAAISVDALLEIALRVEETYRHERQAEIAGGLAMIAGQDAQATRVDGQAFMQAELGRKIGNARILSARQVPGMPGFTGLGMHVRIERVHHLAITSKVLLVRGGPV